MSKRVNRPPTSNEWQIDTGGGQLDAVREQMSMGLNAEGLIANAIVGAGLVAGAVYGIKQSRGSKGRASAPRSARVSPKHPVAQQFDQDAVNDLEYVDSLKKILDNSRPGQYVPQFGKKITAREYLGVQNELMRVLKQRNWER